MTPMVNTAELLPLAPATSCALAITPPPWKFWVLIECRDGLPLITRGTYRKPYDFEPLMSRVHPDGNGVWPYDQFDALRKGKAASLSPQDPELEELALELVWAEVHRQRREHLIVLRHWKERRVVIRQGLRTLALVTHLDADTRAALSTGFSGFGIPEASIEEALMEAARLLELPETDRVDMRAVHRGEPPFRLDNHGAGLVQAVLAYGGQLTLGQLLGLWPAWRTSTILEQLQHQIRTEDLQVEPPDAPPEWTSRTHIRPTPAYLEVLNQPELPHPNEYYTHTEVRQRGWTADAMENLLGKPDHVHLRRRAVSWQFYRKDRVHQAEQGTCFQRSNGKARRRAPEAV